MTHEQFAEMFKSLLAGFCNALGVVDAARVSLQTEEDLPGCGRTIHASEKLVRVTPILSPPGNVEAMFLVCAHCSLHMPE